MVGQGPCPPHPPCLLPLLQDVRAQGLPPGGHRSHRPGTWLSAGLAPGKAASTSMINTTRCREQSWAGRGHRARRESLAPSSSWDPLGTPPPGPGFSELPPSSGDRDTRPVPWPPQASLPLPTPQGSHPGQIRGGRALAPLSALPRPNNRKQEASTGRAETSSGWAGPLPPAPPAELQRPRPRAPAPGGPLLRGMQRYPAPLCPPSRPCWELAPQAGRQPGRVPPRPSLRPPGVWAQPVVGGGVCR